MYSAFEGGACDTCHAAANDGKVVLNQANKKDLCVACREEEARKIDSAKVLHPGAQGDAAVVAPKGAAPISYNRASATCTLVCHGIAHPPAPPATPNLRTHR